MEKKLLVTGATGTVGKPLISILLKQGHAVRATTRNPAAQDELHDLEWTRLTSKAFEGIDRAFLLSPRGHANQYAFLSPLIRQAAEAGVKKIVLMTALGVDADDRIPFRRAELQLEQSGMAWNILRPNWFLQNLVTLWLQEILRERRLRLPAGEAAVSFIDARDISECAAKLLIDDGLKNQALNLTGPEAVNHAELGRRLTQVVEYPIQYESISPEQFRRGFIQAGAPADYTEVLVRLFDVVRAGHMSQVTRAVQEVLGHPARSIEDFGRDHKNAFQPETYLARTG